jgi:alkaline phosphatase D
MRTAGAGFLLSAICLAPAQGQSLHVRDEPVTRIALGSCYKTERDPTVWETIAARNPDALVLLGDNVYADTRDEEALRAKWGELAATPGFAALRDQTTLLATWDDHDYGENDVGRDYPMRERSQVAFLDFLGEPPGSPRRAREGVYESYTFGPPGKRTQIILLDTRYHRSPLVKRESRGPYEDGQHGSYLQDPSSDATMLGAEQWAWLERTLAEPADLRLIGSSIQVVAEDHFWERWDQFPLERTRLLSLLSDTGATGVIFMSGDRHKAEISLLDINRMDEPELVRTPHPIYEITASSLNHPLGRFSNEINRHRLGRVYDDSNFGEILVDWEAEEGPVVTLQIADAVSGRVVIRRVVSIAELHPQRTTDRGGNGHP